MKLYHVIWRWMGVLTRVQNLGGTAPLKFGKAINVQTLASFRTTFYFDHKYLWNSLRYRQAVNFVNYSPFCVEQKKMMNFGPITTKLCLLISILPKHQQFARFRTTVEFDRIYLENG